MLDSRSALVLRPITSQTMPVRVLSDQVFTYPILVFSGNCYSSGMPQSRVIDSRATVVSRLFCTLACIGQGRPQLQCSDQGDDLHKHYT